MKEFIRDYEHLPIGKYIELLEVIKDKEAEQSDKNIAVVSILTDIDEVELYNMPLNHFNSMLQLSAFLSEKPKENTIKNSYKVGEYTLVPCLGAGEMTTAQFIDYQTYVKDVEGNLVEILSVFLIPKGKTYNQGYDLDDVQKAIREELMVTDALGLSTFFLLLFQALLKATVSSLERTAKKMKKKMENPQKIADMEQKIQDLEKIGDGLASLIR